jgi:hypothetical protein
MVQDPFRVDQLRIRPEAASLIRIYDVSGDLAFQDASTVGTLFRDLAGLALANLYTVGTGLGAGYSTIQSALDAVPSSSSPTNPYVILVGPGQYQETVTVVRDGVTIIGWGALLQSAAEANPDGPGAFHTLVIEEGLGTIPRNVLIQGLTITNAHTGYACVRIDGGAGSEVGLGGITLLDCTLRATSPTSNRPISASSMNNLVVQGGSMTGSNATALVYVEECASVRFDGVRDIPAVQLDYDSGGNLPSLFGSSYALIGCPSLGETSSLLPPVSSTLSGLGSLLMVGCTGGADVIMDGDRTLEVRNSAIGDLTLNGTTAATLIATSRGTATGATATLAEPLLQGVATFIAASTVSVTFNPDQPDDNYQVVLTPLATTSDQIPWISAKAATGFTINFSGAQSMSVDWSVIRRV